ncbi:MAG: acylphosphatase [Candidatus Altiarchaeota archaeon]|nr:acylphosphatase [Candidatus Altiarchaeota archaeon]
MERAVIVVKGRVQRAGYRDYIDEAAFNLNLAGNVRNLADGTVEVVCEGPREKIDEFIQRIRIKQYPISVEDIGVRYSKATGEYGDFSIVRDEDLNMVVHERMDIAARYMREMNKDLGGKIDSGNRMLGGKIDSGNRMLGGKIDSGNRMLGGKIDSGNKLLGGKIDSGNRMLGGKIDGVGSKIDSGNRMLAEKIDSGFGRMDQNFTTLRSDYGRISQTMEKIPDKLTEQQKDVVKSNDRLCEAILKLAEKKA